MSFIENGIKNLSIEGLLLVVEDANARLGSHIGMSDEPDVTYVEKQKRIIGLVREELERREVSEGD